LYFIYVICASLEFPSLRWRWESSMPSIHVYCNMLWEIKYKEDYEMICNKFFPTLYQVLFGGEAPYLSLEGKEIVKEYRDSYMKPIRAISEYRKHQASTLVTSFIT
jgi:hypothetical protein